MEFLKKLNPRIDWASGRVQVQQKGRWILIPSVIGESVRKAMLEYK